MQHQQFLSQQWSMGTQCTNMQCNSNQLCNLISSGCLTNTGGKAGSKSGSLPDERFHVTSPTSPIPPKSPSRDATQVQFCFWGLVHASEETLCFPWFSQTTYKDPKLDLLNTSWRSYLYKWMVELKDQHCYQPCSMRNTTFRGQCFQPGLFAGA